jgi:predicted O-methyltransferase YrrM
MRHNQGYPLNSSRGTRLMLVEFMATLGLKKGVEIGCWRGDFAKIMAQNMPGVDLTEIDPWSGYKWHSQEEQEKYYQAAVDNLKPFPNVKIMRTTSMDALSSFADGSLDFVNIDGNHDFDYAITDLIFWTKKVRSGGLILVHDYDAHNTGVIRAVDSYTHCHFIAPWYVIRESGVHPATAFWVNP